MAKNEMTWKAAVEHVLKQNGGPMHYADITDAILDQKLRTSVGATPHDSVSSLFTTDAAKGAGSTFVKVATGIFNLRAGGGAPQTEPDSVESAVEIAPTSPELKIHAYGMYWDRQLIDWTKANPPLLGQIHQNAERVDHYDQRGLYVLYDHRTVVYTGRATDSGVGTRLRDHTVNRHRSRWDRFSWFGFRGVGEDGKLAPIDGKHAGMDDVISIVEAILIEVLEPPQNRQQGKGLSVVEYLQSEDPALVQKKKKALIAEFLDKV